MGIQLVSGSRGVEEMLSSGQGTVLDPRRPTVFLCVFSYGGIEHFTFECLLRETRLFDKAGVNFALHSVHGDALISRSRSKAFSVFMDAKDMETQQPLFDVCFMLDHDLQWQPGALLATCIKAKQVQSMVAGIYACRGIGVGISSRMKDHEVRYKSGEDKLIEAEYLATGFLAIPRVVGEETLKAGVAAAERLDSTIVWPNESPRTLSNLALHQCTYNDKSPFYDYFRPIVVPNTSGIPGTAPYEYASEDWAFGWRARQANPSRPMYGWALPMLVHYGSHGFTVATAYAGREAK